MINGIINTSIKKLEKLAIPSSTIDITSKENVR